MVPACRVGLIPFALGLLACSTEPLPPSPPATLTNEIVFSSRRDGVTFKVYRMKPDGSDVRQIAIGGNASVTTPSVSPNGEWILYNVNGEIWKARVDGSDATNLTRNPATDQSPVWSPDGTRIAFHSDRSGTQFQWDIFVMDSDGSNPTQITSDPAPNGNPKWGANGSGIAFWSTRDGNFQVYLAHLDGLPPVNISDRASNEEPIGWSPDGSTLAIRSGRSQPNVLLALYLIDPDGSNGRMVPLPFIPGGGTWSPDGSRIVVEGTPDLWSVQLDGSDLTNLTNHPASDGFPAWAK